MKISAVLPVLMIFLFGCATFSGNDEPPTNKGVPVHVSVSGGLSVTVYAHHPGSNLGTAICRQVSQEATCYLPKGLTGGADLVLRVKPLAYRSCPLVDPISVSRFCWNSDIIRVKKDEVIILNVEEPLQFTNYAVHKRKQ